MSTRCTLTVRDSLEDEIGFSLYRHSDGFPQDVMADLTEVLPYAWPLPRFEASDFSAAIVTAWKLAHVNLIKEMDSPQQFRGGYIRLTSGRDDHADTEYHYEIFPSMTQSGNCDAIMVQPYKAVRRGQTRYWRKLKMQMVATATELDAALAS